MSKAIFRMVLLVAGAALAAGPPSATAFGTYTQYACHLPDGDAAPLDSITGTTGGLGSIANGCASGGGLSITLPTTSQATEAWGKWRYVPPSGTAPIRVVYTLTVRNYSDDQSSSTRRFIAPGADCGLLPRCPETQTVNAPITSSGPIEFFGYCEWEPCRGAQPGDGFVSIDNIAITLQDDQLPTFVGQPTGSLFDRNKLRGTVTTAFTAADQGGGIYMAALIVDGVEQPRTTIDANGGACAEPFVMTVPCKLQVDGSLSLDTTTLNDGPHNISVVVFDVTKTNSATFGPVPVEVDNVPDPPTGGSGQGGGDLVQPQTTAKVVAVSRPSRMSFARAGLAKGRLVDDQGRPIGGSTLDVYFTIDVPNAPVQLVGQTITKADGTFAFAIAKGPSRRFTVKDRATGATWTFTVAVPAPLKLAASRRRLDNGQKLMLTAYLAGESVPAKSAAVAFQVLIGHQWRTFATRDLDGSGTARVGHRFKVTYQRLTYRFRAVVVGRRPFPFANATSNQAAVQVN